jgi:hypothetical protein
MFRWSPSSDPKAQRTGIKHLRDSVRHGAAAQSGVRECIMDYYQTLSSG